MMFVTKMTRAIYEMNQTIEDTLHKKKKRQ